MSWHSLWTQISLVAFNLVSISTFLIPPSSYSLINVKCLIFTVPEFHRNIFWNLSNSWITILGTYAIKAEYWILRFLVPWIFALCLEGKVLSLTTNWVLLHSCYNFHKVSFFCQFFVVTVVAAKYFHSLTEKIYRVEIWECPYGTFLTLFHRFQTFPNLFSKKYIVGSIPASAEVLLHNQDLAQSMKHHLQMMIA